MDNTELHIPFPGYYFTSLGMKAAQERETYDLDGALQDSWRAAGRELAAAQRRSHKAYMLNVGDWLNWGIKSYGEQAMELAVEDTGYSTGHLYNVSWVCRHTPQSLRELDVTFTMLVDSMRIKDSLARQEFLETAVDKRLRGEAFDRALAAATGIPELAQDPLQQMADAKYELEVENGQLQLDLQTQTQRAEAAVSQAQVTLAQVRDQVVLIDNALVTILRRYDVTGSLEADLHNVKTLVASLLADMENETG